MEKQCERMPTLQKSHINTESVLLYSKGVYEGLGVALKKSIINPILIQKSKVIWNICKIKWNIENEILSVTFYVNKM